MTKNTQSSLHGLFRLSAEQYADCTAVVFDDGLVSTSLTYSQLDTYSDLVTAWLKKAGCSCGEVVGVMLNPSLLMPAVLIGIQKAGCAYLPVDLTLGGSAVQELLKSCQARFMFTDVSVNEKIQRQTNIKKIQLDCSTQQPFGVSLLHIEGAPTSHSLVQTLAYVITTSGTTGKPKLVHVPHSCIMPNIINLKHLLSPCPGDVVFMASPLTFDPSVVELFLALGSGATLLIVPHAVKVAPMLCEDILCRRNSVTILQSTPTFLSRFGPERLRSSLLSSDSSLRALILGGEAFPSLEVFKSWRADKNRTKVYNIYGITEVSCWAMLKEVTEDDIRSPNKEISLGEPMLDTTVQVLDTNGEKIKLGEGQLFVGGEKRRCLVSEVSCQSRLDMVAVPTMHATGDWVRVEEDGRIVYLGRKDEQIKRHGKRMNLLELTKFVEQQFPRLFCVAVNAEDRLYLFMQAAAEDTRFIDLVDQRINEYLPEQYIPDGIHIVQEMPMTKHGKVDKNALLTLLKRKNRYNSGSTVRQTLQDVWKEVIGHLPRDDDRWIVIGGNSLMAVHMCQELEAVFQTSFPLLLDTVLHKKFNDINNYITSEVGLPGTSRFHEQPREDKSRMGSDIFDEHFQPSTAHLVHGFSNGAMSNIQNELETNKLTTDSKTWHVKRKRKLQEAVLKEEKSRYLPSSATTISVQRGSKFFQHGSESCKDFHFQKEISQLSKMEILELWRYNTGKCVDASPLLVMTGRDHGDVFIGSHSHKMSAIDFHTGNSRWCTELEDRIESSASLSACGKYVIVGCYNSSVYVLDVDSGAVWWQFETSGSVKSSPCVNPVSSLVYVGSHDQNLYALDIKSKQCAWQRYLGGGSVFSSPVISKDSCHIYAATLTGKLFQLSAESGVTEWVFYDKLSAKPFFSSPAITQLGVCIGCVNGRLYHLDSTGKLLWSYTTEGPIFSTPCVYQSDSRETELIIFGSHDHHVYCLSADVARLRWKIKMSSQVYSTPFVFTFKVDTAQSVSKTKSVDVPGEFLASVASDNNDCSIHNGREFNQINMVCACSTDGTLRVLNLENGCVVCQHSLPGEVFSSPIVYGNKIVVGCRDDNVYCLRLIS